MARAGMLAGMRDTEIFIPSMELSPYGIGELCSLGAVITILDAKPGTKGVAAGDLVCRAFQASINGLYRHPSARAILPLYHNSMWTYEISVSMTYDGLRDAAIRLATSLSPDDRSIGARLLMVAAAHGVSFPEEAKEIASETLEYS